MSSVVAWVLVFHVVGLILWLGALLAALRLAAVGGETARPLAAGVLRSLAHPGAALTVLTGAALLALMPVFLRAGWLHVKLLLVILLIAADLRLTILCRRGTTDGIEGSLRPLVWLTPALSLAIVVLAVLKPF